MSSARNAVSSWLDPSGIVEEADGESHYHLLAILSVGALSASFLAVLYHVVDVVGGVTPFLTIVAGTIALAAVLRYLSKRAAILLGTGFLAAGMVLYLLTMPESQLAKLSIGRIFRDTIALLTGFSVLRMTNVQTWALAVTAGPTFLTWYFAFRREYRAAVAVGGLTFSFFVLTGDSGALATMVGVLGATGAIGFSSLAVHGASRVQGEVLAGIFALMIIGAGTVTAVPGGGSPLVSPGATSTSGDLVSAESRLGVGGSLDLSPKVLFTVRSQEEAYWRVSVYDRFTGSEWIRTGPERGEPASRPGYTYPLRQRYLAHQSLETYPAAPTPRRVSGVSASITEFGDLRGAEVLEPKHSYRVVSDRPYATESNKRAAGTDYPSHIEERYLRVPQSTSDRVTKLTDQITAGQESPYAQAKAIETWLEGNKGYSLSVENPSGNIVDEFIYEMEAGYCVYFASSMVVMLRTQDIPARFVVGYTPGQAINDDTYVVRGLDSHAWVEMYLPDIGWVRLDPTPSGPRISAEQDRIREARENDVEDVDTFGSSREPLAQNETDETSTNRTTPNESVPSRQRRAEDLERFLNESSDTPATTDEPINATIPPIDGEEGGPSLPAPETIAIWALVGFGVVAGARRTRVAERTYRRLWLHWLPRGDPGTVIEGTFQRVTFLLEDIHRPRHPGETVREYTAAVTEDERVYDIVRLRERAKYAGRAEAEGADRARELTREWLSDHAAAYRFSPSTVFNRLLS